MHLHLTHTILLHALAVEGIGVLKEAARPFHSKPGHHRRGWWCNEREMLTKVCPIISDNADPDWLLLSIVGAQSEQSAHWVSIPYFDIINFSNTVSCAQATICPRVCHHTLNLDLTIACRNINPKSTKSSHGFNLKSECPPQVARN
jgi:hypothetical protein